MLISIGTSPQLECVTNSDRHAVWACHRQHLFTTAGQGRGAQRGAQRAPDAVVQSAASVTRLGDRYTEVGYTAGTRASLCGVEETRSGRETKGVALCTGWMFPYTAQPTGEGHACGLRVKTRGSERYGDGGASGGDRRR